MAELADGATQIVLAEVTEDDLILRRYVGEFQVWLCTKRYLRLGDPIKEMPKLRERGGEFAAYRWQKRAQKWIG
jgi:hypothetical protein